MLAKVNNCNINKKTNDKFELIAEISWEGSWKTDINCDGVYIFAKAKRKENDEYTSVKLLESSKGEFDYADKSTADFKVEGNSLGLYIPNTKLGAFVFPVQMCEDKKQSCKISLLCEGDGEFYDIKIFVIEMVYVPQDGHFVGDSENGISKGGRLKNCFYKYPDKGAYYIDSEDEIKFAPQEDCLYSDMDTPNGRQEETPFVIPKEFPKGYKAMWYMKYSLNNEQFVMFLNCLTRQQQKTHVMSDISGDYIENYFVLTNTAEEMDRSAVYCRREGNTTDKPVKFYTYAPMRSCNAMAYRDVAAFACFSGLRLLTELEYEKACRGTLPAVAGEFAWGSTNIGRVYNFDGADGSGYEKAIAQKEGQLANCNYGEGIAPFEKAIKTVPDNPGWIGPISSGILGKNEVLEGYSKRECTGASYYGIMELSGNVWENVVSVGRPEGRKYDGSYGNGKLDENGNHTMENWPDSETAVGNGVRGGVFVSPNPDYVRMALRVFAAHTKAEKRYHGGLRIGF